MTNDHEPGLTIQRDGLIAASTKEAGNMKKADFQSLFR
jgi:hypothetical protein